MLQGRWLEAPHPGWDALMRADPGATPAHHPEVVRAFASASDGMSPRFFALERSGQLCGGMAAVLQRRAGFHWIHAMSALLSGAPLAIPGTHAEVDAACAAGLEALAREVGAVGGAWACYRPAGDPVAPEILARVSGETRTFEAAQVRLERGIGTLLQKMDRKTRKEMRQARERGLVVAEEPARLTEAYSLYRAQATGWSAHRAVPLELLRRLLAGRGADGAPVARLFTVRDGRGLLAAVLALDSPRETMLWWSGTHPAARVAHAFPLLLWTVAEWAETQSRDRLNLGASAGRGPLVAFKESLGSVGFSYPVRWLDARHAPASGRAIAWLQSRIRRGRPRGEPA